MPRITVVVLFDLSKCLFVDFLTIIGATNNSNYSNVNIFDRAIFN